MSQRVVSVIAVLGGFLMMTAAAVRPAHAWLDPFYAVVVGLILVIVGLLGRFRRVRVPHLFEAEMWDDVQLKAEDLVRRLKGLAESLIQIYVDSSVNAGYTFSPGEPYSPFFLFEKRPLVLTLAEIAKDRWTAVEALKRYDDTIERRMMCIAISEAAKRIKPKIEVSSNQLDDIAEEMSRHIGMSPADSIARKIIQKINGSSDISDPILRNLEKDLHDIAHFRNHRELRRPERWDRSW